MRRRSTANQHRRTAELVGAYTRPEAYRVTVSSANDGSSVDCCRWLSAQRNPYLGSVPPRTFGSTTGSFQRFPFIENRRAADRQGNRLTGDGDLDARRLAATITIIEPPCECLFLAELGSCPATTGATPRASVRRLVFPVLRYPPGPRRAQTPDSVCHAAATPRSPRLASPP